MSQVIRQEVTNLRERAARLASEVLATPRPESEYLIACGRYREMLAQAASLEKRFLSADLTDDDAHAEPESRVDRARQRHRPRQY